MGLTMNDKELLAKLETAYEAFSVPLRMGDGLNTQLFSDLYTALEQCCKCWKDKDNIPKRAASIFVDTYSSMVSASYFYDEKKRQEIDMIADELTDLIRACVEPKK